MTHLIIAGNVALDEFYDYQANKTDSPVLFRPGGCAVNSFFSAIKDGVNKLTITIYGPLGNDNNSKIFLKLFNKKILKQFKSNNNISDTQIEAQIKVDFQIIPGPTVKVIYRKVDTEFTAITCTPFINSSFDTGLILDKIKNKYQHKSGTSVNLLLAGTAFIKNMNSPDFVDELTEMKCTGLIDTLACSLGGRGPFLKQFAKLVEICDIAFLNHTEARDIFGFDCTNPDTNLFSRYQDKLIVITRAELGVMAIKGNHITQVPNQIINKNIKKDAPLNTIGAGDTFAGVFTAEYIQLKDSKTDSLSQNTIQQLLINASKAANKKIIIS